MKIKGKKIFITGGGGFIGSHICQRLIENNEITVYDNGSRDAIRYTDLRKNAKFKYVKGDILDKSLLKKSINNAQVVIHLAAIAGVSNYFRFPQKTMQTNILGTNNILEVAKEIHPEVFVNFSSSEVYGPFSFEAKEDQNTTQGELKNSRWTYSVSKLAAEHLCFSFMKERSLTLISIRPFNIYGPRQIGEGAVQIFIPQAIKNKPIQIANDGNQIRSWCYIDDLVDGLILALENPDSRGEVFNLGNPRETITTLGLAERIIQFCNSRSKIVFVPQPSGGEVKVRVPSIEKAGKMLGFKPRVTMREGLKKTIAWFKHEYEKAV